MNQRKIIFMAADCESSRWVYHFLKDILPITHAVIEVPISKKTLLKNRIRKIGLLKVSGQVLFTLLVVPVLKWRARERKKELVRYYQLSNLPFDEKNCTFVPSVNGPASWSLLKDYQPQIVLVNGTRIISKKTLQCTPAVFINMHVGITPWYRGSHGGYWALYKNDQKNFGTTIHLVDSGIDTGSVLKHVFASPDKADNFTTYPIIQVAEGIKALPEVIESIFNDHYKPTGYAEKGRLYYQPTIWEYLFNKTR